MAELRQVLRQLVRRPGTPPFAVFTLALGVAATASVFLVVQGTLLEELPYPEPDRLALVWRGTAENHRPRHEWDAGPPRLLLRDPRFTGWAVPRGGLRGWRSDAGFAKLSAWFPTPEPSGPTTPASA